MFDRDLCSWWLQQRAQAQAEGEPITTWQQLEELLRATFLPQEEKESALHDLINVAQQPGESMVSYLLRADRLMVKARGRMDDHAIMQIVFDRVQKSEWPFTWAAARRAMQAKQITNFAGLRALLQREAMAEPMQQRPREGDEEERAADTRAEPESTEQRAGEENDETDDDEEGENSKMKGSGAPGGAGGNTTARVAAVQGTKGSKRAQVDEVERCARCRGYGHSKDVCPSPETRACFTCGQKGHISAECNKSAPNEK